MEGLCIWRKQAVTSITVDNKETRNCLNCGAWISNQFCSVCGQETRLHVPSAHEFIHEFIGHYVALEGRLWKTLGFLLSKPGFLSAEYIAGRRRRYVEPLRVYLSLSIIFFAVLKFGGAPVAIVDDPAPRTAAVSVKTTGERPAATVAAADPVRDDDVVLDAVIKTMPGLEERAKRFASKPGAERARLMTAGFFAYVPYALFILMPLFALYLKLLYLGTGRRYGEHLLFALHTNAFAFAALSLMALTIRLDWGLTTTAIVFWIVAYLPLAMRRVYQGSRWLTGVRWLALSVLHLASVGVAIISAFSAAILL